MCTWRSLAATMWITPEEVLISAGLWTTESAGNPFFRLQRRKGHGGNGFSSLIVGTLDSILDSKTPPYRILHSTPSSEIHYTISVANTKEEIEQDWQWIQTKLLPSLDGFEGEDDVGEYVKLVGIVDVGITQKKIYPKTNHTPKSTLP